MPATVEPLLNIEELAARLNVSPWWVKRHMHDGSLPYVKVGRHVRFVWEAVLASIEDDEPAARHGNGTRRTASS